MLILYLNFKSIFNLFIDGILKIVHDVTKSILAAKAHAKCDGALEYIQALIYSKVIRLFLSAVDLHTPGIRLFGPFLLLSHWFVSIHLSLSSFESLFSLSSLKSSLLLFHLVYSLKFCSNQVDLSIIVLFDEPPVRSVDYLLVRHDNFIFISQRQDLVQWVAINHAACYHHHT